MNEKPTALFWWMRLGCAWGEASERVSLPGLLLRRGWRYLVRGLAGKKRRNEWGDISPKSAQ